MNTRATTKRIECNAGMRRSKAGNYIYWITSPKTGKTVELFDDEGRSQTGLCLCKCMEAQTVGRNRAVFSTDEMRRFLKASEQQRARNTVKPAVKS